MATRMVLPDTSVWVDYYRLGVKGRAAGMRQLLDAGEVATCGPIMAELLAGLTGEAAQQIEKMLLSIPWVDLPPGAWQDIGAVARRLRQAGQALPLTDLTIAVAAARAGHPLWTFDSDFERIRQALDGLELYESA